ncbi:hypothetical protein [Pollutibacter soli]|uniref:hypothetical protein n=1 Tax=Pollutibacter soli TaxID=3034157 RepID=UPI0030141B99
MMMMRRMKILALVIGLICFSCGSQEDYFDFVPLEKYTYTEGKLASGTRVKLLAYSGGQENKGNKIYYSQFLVVPENSTDTVVVLSPMISYNKSETDSSKIHTPAFSFNPPPDLLNARFDDLDSFALKSLHYTTGIPQENKDASQNLEKVIDNTQFQHLVITNKKMPEFDGKHYKTVMGVLHFRKQPM